MDIEQQVTELQRDKQKIEAVLQQQHNRMQSIFSVELEQKFWKDREDRLTRLIVRAFFPATVFYLFFELISLPLNYFSMAAEFRRHDISLIMTSYTTGWLALFSIFIMSRNDQWKKYYSVVVTTVICISLTVVQSVLLSVQSVEMSWRGTLIIIIALMFAYLCSGLRPRNMLFAGLLSAVLTLIYLETVSTHVSSLVLSNVFLLGNLVGLGLSVLTISTERIRFLQSIIIKLDSQIHELLGQHLYTLSHQDTLTALMNRRGFEDRFSLLFREAQEQQAPLALLFIDVDFFKLYNDFYGHQNGDIALIRVAQTLKRLSGEQGVAVRFGGEEFLLVLKNTDMQNAVLIAESILTDIREQCIPHADSSVSEYLTLSIGVAVYTGAENISEYDLLNQADNALYQAKRQGRDRVMAAHY
ncbi:sensor domain-containing diguanylate cyclase [Acinetobacter sp. WCHAc010052]|uniref:GGDEF domain-containing protein n=1 Tax=Acinetobacter sp. WCHAc010052 TaxID=2004647 RepID=UPI000B3C3E5E|nr:GGDEF domain-containing protein [Acinetobacter sp. WCHAc010052]AXY59569.1 GGDEF domain-containing protein [Acinetobacter sp. WCHAc010052]